ncbi:peptidoglycan recognition protein family protein [Actinacidiphila sp. bgisy167]|uniref:peptidoglycan recognition protein family protein n=1 Tax=Actinacidiphila sp. bgisy167 TaxID=3413797 RepID=UPI003D7560A7
MGSHRAAKHARRRAAGGPRRATRVWATAAATAGAVAVAAIGVQSLLIRTDPPPVHARPAPSPQLMPLPDPAARAGLQHVPLHPAREPAIVPRKSWGADESLRTEPPHYSATVKAVFLHHTDSGNGYKCADVPETIRDIYSGHIQSRHWDDVAYNFFVDKCGTIYEGRAGGSDRPVTGAHSLGFNQDTMGIAAIGTYDDKGSVPPAMAEAIARLAAWKLGLSDIDPRGKVTLVSSSSKSRFKKGERAVFHVIAGHRDAYMTDCPGKELYAKLPEIRTEAARLQGRPPPAAAQSDD